MASVGEIGIKARVPSPRDGFEKLLHGFEKLLIN